MKSTRLQLLVTLVAIVVAAALFFVKGPPPQMNLLKAANKGDLTQVRHCLDWGIEVDHVWGFAHDTPLHFAALAGDEQTARLLISRGALVNARDRDGLTPLHLAATEGHVAVARILIMQGADVNALESGNGTPLHFVAGSGDVTFTRLLLDSGAAVNAEDCLRRTPLHVVVESSIADPKHGAQLAEVAQLLISRGARVDALDSNGRTPLGRAAYTKIHSSRLRRAKDSANPVFEVLRRHGATEGGDIEH